MLSQRGTLNVVDGKALLMLSVPVTVFHGVDDNGDGKLSQAELRAHWSELEAQAAARIQLSDERGPRPVAEFSLSPIAPDDAPNAPVSQIVVQAQWTLDSPPRPLQLRAEMFGTGPGEDVLAVTANRGSDEQLLLLNAEHPSRVLFPQALTVFGDYVREGIGHILLGFDHLLFLLVVLSAGWGWRQVVIALTAFTVGHSITLVISTWGGFQVPSALVEPAIAATIVGMAAFDWRARLRNLPPPALLPAVLIRYALVFGCSLIHGLGLASSFSELGLDAGHRVPSLAGFNIGIELGQLCFATAALALMAALRKWRGPAALAAALRYSSYAAMAIGAVWFVGRI